jgi:tRNA-2-methylthio-N6-dimethylallyladenosine synthase
MKYHIVTYGCQMNTSDSERIASVLERLGYTKAKSEKEADFLAFNTCSVRQKAEDKVLGLRHKLTELKKNNSRLRVAITGCMVRDTSTQKVKGKRDKLLLTMPELDMAFRIEDVAQLPDLIKAVDPSIIFEDTLDEGTLENYFNIVPKKASPYSVFVPIMTGCDKFCTYCIVPFTRGREYSRDFDEILAECEKHVNEGALEITLVGQTVNSYGLSFNDKKSGKFEAFGASPFAALLREVDKLYAKGLRRLRFTSPHPRDFNDTLIETLGELKTICPYIHMPVQSGDDRTLRRMNRNYTVEEYKTIMRKLQKALPGCAISTDIIVGFCGETDDEFETTLKMYEEMEWDMCYHAKYSPRKGTYSERQLPDDIPAKVKADRWHRLNEILLATAAKKHAAFVGQTLEVLVTQQIGQSCVGRSPHFKEVQFKSGRPLTGTLVPVTITKSGVFHLEGELA